ncbi:MAG: hypothetical protein EOO61_10685 [Hymenobacter sp.]|nr:MAG: hypothetical protein EOO61_10685 [Hymenobacter sp.]
MKRRILYLLLLVYSFNGMAQQIPVIAEHQLETLAELIGEDLDDDYLQQLYDLQKHPLNLNRATAEDWQQLKWLTDLQIQNLLQYKMLTIDDL